MINKTTKFLFIFCFLCTALLCGDNDASNSVEAHQPYFVGELGTSWQFPSDHLPRGMSIENVHIVFWNILNKNYLGHIEENTQGLLHSSILEDDVPLATDYPLTIREAIVVQSILEMMTHPTHPRSLIALQEVHPDVQSYLHTNLSSNWVIATPPGQPISEDIFLYDSNVFELITLEAVKYDPQRPKTIFTLTLREKSSNKIMRFLQSHIPGGPNSAEGCAKFAEEVLRQYDPHYTIALMGDMNQSPLGIQKALEKAFAEHGEQPFRYLPIAHPSHMNTKLHASWIDNFFVYSPDVQMQPSDNPEELFNSLVPIVQLLNEYKTKE